MAQETSCDQGPNHSGKKYGRALKAMGFEWAFLGLNPGCSTYLGKLFSYSVTQFLFL